ncbi:MAG TPA: hypothetical protein VNS22_21195 [Geminicoccus sp.]|uniref:hypothetical protein n=1 Tax=Geminicoccus sp. TaxID=2024832 RepID=UPI002CBD139F|nr:hypothetical protein [Geminicoccus sp.]HWL70871.1 hypothetical protein [Geminicoccus sp.]
MLALSAGAGTAAAAMIAQPASPAAQAASAPDQELGPIRLRLGTQGAAARIVLEAAHPFTMTRGQEAGELVLRFDRDLLGGGQDLGIRLSRVALSARTAGPELRLRLRHQVSLEPDWLSEQHLVLDLRPEDVPAPSAAAAGSDAPSHALPALLAEAPVDAAPDPATIGQDPGPRPRGAHAAHWATAPDRPATSSGPTEAAPAAGLEVRAMADATGAAVLEFHWDDPVPAAAFWRDDRLWLVFGARAERLRADPAALARRLAHRVRTTERQLGPDATVFRFGLAVGVAARLLPPADGRTWRLMLAADDPGQDPVAHVEIREGPVLHLPGVGRPVELTDPRAGDRLLVAPVAAAQARPVAAGGTPELEIMTSLAGLVMRPLRPDLHAVPRTDGVRITGATPPIPQVPPGAAEPSPAAEDARLDFAGLGGRAGLAERRLAQERLARAPDDPAARAGLVRVLLGAGLLVEADAVLAGFGPADEMTAPLTTAAAALARPTAVPPASLAGLGEPDRPEADLWQAFLHARQGHDAEAGAALAASGDVLSRYPPALRRLLGEPVVRSQIRSGAIDAALAALDGLVAAAAGDESEAALWKLLQAEALAREQALPAARRRLAVAEQEGDADTALQAKAVTLDLDLQAGATDAAGAKAALDRLAPAWEGRRVQPAMERRRTRAAQAAGDWPTALAAAERAAALPDPEPSTDAPAAEPVDVLAAALVAPDLDLFRKLALVQDRPLAELRREELRAPLAALVRQLQAAGQDQAALLLHAAVPGLPVDREGVAAADRGSHAPAMSGATSLLLQELDAAAHDGFADPARLDQALAGWRSDPEG